MTQIAYPLDDTEYLAENVRLFHAGRTSGLLNVTGNDLSVTASSGMEISVSPGYAFLLTGSGVAGGITFRSDADEQIVVSTASTYDRYDYVSVRYNHATNKCLITYVKGSATRPTPVRNADQYEVILAIVTVKANTTSISQADIEDTRLDESLCGLTADGLLKIPTEGFQKQFDSFMSSIKGTLDGDVAGNLNNKIDTNTKAISANEKSITETNEKLDEHIKSVGYVVVNNDPEVTPPEGVPEGHLVLYVES